MEQQHFGDISLGGGPSKILLMVQDDGHVSGGNIKLTNIIFVKGF